MKQLYILSFLLFFNTTIIFAQPANDNCSSAQTISPNGTCYPGTTVGANDSWTGTVGCQSGNNHPDAWYSFVATGTTLAINVTAGTLTGNIEFVLVESAGPCTGLTITGSLCGGSPLTGNIIGLQPGATYYYTISSSTSSEGTFTTCVTNTTPPPMPGQDCNNAALLCNSNSVSQPTSNAGFANQEVTSANSCWGFGGERQSKWFKFTAGCSGTLEFNINPIVAGNDYDWAVWNISTDPNGCTTKGNSIACNWSACSGSTGLSSCPLSEPGVQTCGSTTDGDPCGPGNLPRAWGNWSSPGGGASTCLSSTLNVIAGNTYALLVDNFSASNNGFTLTFGGACGGGTAVIGPDATFSYSAGTCGTYNFTKTCPTTNSTFLWQFGDGATAATQNASHTYSTFGNFVITLQVTDALGCVATFSQTINIVATPFPGVTTPVTYCVGTAASPLTATGTNLLWYTVPTGGTGSSTAPTPSTASPGTTSYYVTQTIGGCESPRVQIDVIVNPLPTVSVNSQTICAGQSATLTATPSTSGGTYSWSQGGQTTQSITVSPVSTTTYTVTYTLAGCPSTTNGTVTVNAAPTVNVNSQTICAGQSATLTATPSAGGGIYSWSPGGQTTQSITVSPASTTTYTVTYTLAACPSSASASGAVTVNAAPTVNVNSQTICAGQSATLTATPSAGGGIYSWSPGGQTTQSITVSPVSTTTYTVAYTLAGCPSSASASGTVTVNAAPTVNVNSQTICAAQNATLTATPSTGGGTYSWSPGGETTQSITVSPASTTTYTVAYTLAGCPFSTASSTVTVNSVTPSVSITASSTSICSGNPITFTAIPTNGGSTPIYQWKINGVDVPGTSSATYTSTSLNNGDVITVVMTSNDGCASPPTGTSNSITVSASSVTPSVSIAASTISICTGSNVTFTATPTNGGNAPTYQWLLNGVGVPGAMSSTYTLPSQNGAVVTVMMTSNAGCTTIPTAISNAYTINASSISATASAPDIACGQITGSITVNTSGGNAPYSYSIDTGNSYQSSNVFSGLAAGTYSIRVKDSAGCFLDVTATLNSAGMINLQINSPLPVCAPAIIDLTSAGITAGSDAGLTYSYWNDAATTIPLTSPNAVIIAGTYYIKAGSPNGCFITKPVDVIIENKIDGIRYPTLTAMPNVSITLQARTLGNNYTYQWLPPDGLNTTTIKEPVFNYDKKTEYLIKITSEKGCVIVDTLFVDLIFTSLAPNVFVPKAWTPNGDGQNDFLFPFTVNITQLKYFRIYNRWGQKVFETNIIGQGWDGKYNGNPQIMDVYTWTIEAISVNGYKYKFAGKAVLLR